MTMSGISDQSGSNISIYLYTSVSYEVFKFLLVNLVFYAVGLNDVCGIQQLFTETTLFHNMIMYSLMNKVTFLVQSLVCIIWFDVGTVKTKLRTEVLNCTIYTTC